MIERHLILCRVDGCKNIIYAKGYCEKHYSQIRHCGKILERTVRDPNKIYDYGNYIGVVLYDVKSNPIAETFVDKDREKKIRQHKWYRTGRGYVATNISGKTIRLHQFLYPGYQIDHIDRNPLNNRSKNLRPATQAKNARNRGLHKNNTSGIPGVHWKKSSNKWCAEICYDYKRIHLGYFKNLQDAAKIRLDAEKKYFGEFSPNK